MQIRRTCCNNDGAEQKSNDTLMKYANKQKRNGQWPEWYHQLQEGQMVHPTRFPAGQPHPSTKAYQAEWNNEIKAMGPIRLVIEAVVWNGLAIDNNFKIWQMDEEPIDVLGTPYQSLKVQLHMMATRARNKAEYSRRAMTGRTVGFREIDREASQIDKNLSDLEQGIVRTAMMGGTMAK